MRVLVGPRADLGRDLAVTATAYALAGAEGMVVPLKDVGVRNLSRPLSAAEVALLRKALTGDARDGEGLAEDEGAIVGYVCRGCRVAAEGMIGPTDGEDRLVVVTDHANLTWRSPLTGPNDDSAGPRFPSMTGIYSPETAVSRLGAAPGIIVTKGVVAGVLDDSRPTAHEAEVARAQGHAAVSSELVPVVIVAAHLGLRVAAVVLTAES
jgi:hypothetical protein